MRSIGSRARIPTANHSLPEQKNPSCRLFHRPPFPSETSFFEEGAVSLRKEGGGEIRLMYINNREWMESLKGLFYREDEFSFFQGENI